MNLTEIGILLVALIESPDPVRGFDRDADPAHGLDRDPDPVHGFDGEPRSCSRL